MMSSEASRAVSTRNSTLNCCNVLARSSVNQAAYAEERLDVAHVRANASASQARDSLAHKHDEHELDAARLLIAIVEAQQAEEHLSYVKFR
jgi:hypothetical protein